MKRCSLTHLASAALFLAVATFWGCSQQESSPQKVAENQTAPTTISAKRIVVGLDDGLAPITFRDPKGNLVGHDIDTAREAFKRMGLDMEFKSIAWTNKDEEMKSKRIDVIWSGMTITEERKKQYAFSHPYLKNIQTIVVPLNSPIKTKADLGGKIVGYQEGSFVVPVLEKFSGMAGPIQKLEKYPEVATTLVALLENKIQAAVLDGVAVNYYANRTPGKFRVLDEDFGADQMGVGLRLDDTALLEKLNKALDSMAADGTSQAIYARWFGEKK